MSTIQVFWHQSAPLCFVQAVCIWHSTSWVSSLKMIYLNFVQVPDLTAFITKRVFSTVIMCLSTIVTYHVKKCASVAVIVYLISKTLWSYKILNTHYHRHIMQIIANYTDLGQITATIRKKILLTIQPEILLFLSSLSCSLRITRSLIFISLNTDFKQRKQTSRLYHWSIIKYQTCILLWLVR